MDLYDSIEDFIEAYLYFDEPPHKVPYVAGQHRNQHLQYRAEGRDPDSCNANSPCGPYDPQVGFLSPEGQNPPEGNVFGNFFHDEVNTQQLQTSGVGTEPAYFEDNLMYTYTEVKSIQPLSCPECYFKCLDINEMRYHESTYHANETPIESAVDLTQLTYVTVAPGQPGYRDHSNPSESCNTYYNL